MFAKALNLNLENEVHCKNVFFLKYNSHIMTVLMCWVSRHASLGLYTIYCSVSLVKLFSSEGLKTVPPGRAEQKKSVLCVFPLNSC